MARGRGFGGPPRSARPVKLNHGGHITGRSAKTFRTDRFGERPSNGERYAKRAEEPPYGPEWVRVCKLVKQRDGYTCTNPKCRAYFPPPMHGKLDVHHIIRREKGGPDTPDNLRTLCKPCHADQHAHLKRIGYGQPKKRRL